MSFMTLNPEQQQAVTAADGQYLVLAGAGSGKTRVLVQRIAWLIQNQDTSPESILAVTFTNKAAGEMKKRIQQLLPMPIDAMWVGTFHGLAHRLLRLHAEKAGLPQQFQIIDSEDQLRIIKNLLKEMDIDDSKWPPRKIQGYINARKDEGRRAAQVVTYQDYYAEKMLDIYRLYEQTCKETNVVDFAELLLRVHELWREDPELLHHYQQRFQHILVDEFQDTNSIQYAWIRQLATPGTNLMLVGDDDQAIYGWRGAKLEHILRFTKDFPSAKTIRLEQNYRSTKTILQAANSVICNNGGRLGKELWTDGDIGQPIDVFVAFNELDEAGYIADTIKEQYRNTGCYADIAILYRSNAQSRVLEEALIQSRIPYRIYGGQRFFERAEIKDALAYLRLIAHPDDNYAYERVINHPARGLGARSLEIIRNYASQQGISLWRASEDLVKEKELSARAISSLQGFLNLINKMQEETENLVLHEKVAYTIEESGLMALFEMDRSERGKSRVDNLKELVNASQSFDFSNAPELDPLLAFLAHAVLEAGETQATENEDCIQMMTMHAAKGLEFPTVFIAGMENGLFPSQYALDSVDQYEEERRLCYVGMTRAMKHLILTYAKSRQIYGRTNYHRSSDYLNEIPENLLKAVRFGASTQFV